MFNYIYPPILQDHMGGFNTSMSSISVSIHTHTHTHAIQYLKTCEISCKKSLLNKNLTELFK